MLTPDDKILIHAWSAADVAGAQGMVPVLLEYQRRGGHLSPLKMRDRLLLLKSMGQVPS